MTKHQGKLKLGKGSVFVKRRLSSGAGHEQINGVVVEWIPRLKCDVARL